MPVVMQHASAAKRTVPNLTFWGLVASPFQLKMQALADAAGLRWQRWPEQAGTLQAVATYRRLAKSRRQKTVERFPQRIPGLDEYPAVPYYSFDSRQFYYDSTGLALHLDTLQIALEPLVPLDAPLRFICRLIDEAFDEFGLYMAHHNRWVTSAATNTMGELSVQELRHEHVLNPALGLRAIRWSLSEPGMFRQQLRAMANSQVPNRERPWNDPSERQARSSTSCASSSARSGSRT